MDSQTVEEVESVTKQKTKASVVRVALEQFFRLRNLRELADLAGVVELRHTDGEIEAMEER